MNAFDEIRKIVCMMIGLVNELIEVLHKLIGDIKLINNGSCFNYLCKIRIKLIGASKVIYFD